MEENKIEFGRIEEKWQKKWAEAKIFESRDNSPKKKYYVLEMFPYPSASGLHMGHTFNYTIGDVFSRFKLMQGFNVLHPGGYDSLGLPAENAAIKEGKHPEDYTNNSIKNFMKQQKRLGITYDWGRMVNTADLNYYKWDQWIFLKMFEKGLAYQKNSAVNWCPKCNTVLANEQAQGGECDRCGSKVEIKQMNQWFFKITDYADRLLEGHKKLNWPEKTIAMQKNWIGKSHGTEIDFIINDKPWKIFTTRPDTIFGVTFMVISSQHSRLMELVTREQKKEVERFLKKLTSVSEKDLGEMEKEGVFTGSYAINPANGDEVPVYAGNFVVADYGAGMVMAVPAHDQRDFEFAKKYKIKIKQVIEGKLSDTRAFTEEGKLINSTSEFNGINSKEAIGKITEWLIKNKKARKVVNYKLRDWCISRQRYWGTPIPLIRCENCGVVPVPEDKLPVILPKNVKFGGGNPLLTNQEWLNVKCPKCGESGKRETDTMDTFVNSSWYFLRFCDPHNKEKIFDKEKVKYWMPVDLYIGGAEHACMHLIFCRFYTMFLHDLGLINFEEPAPRLFHQGMINDAKGERMSKSKGNGIEPIETMNKYGVDTTRFFMLSESSPDKGFNWSDAGIQGSLRFTKNVFENFEKIKVGKDSEEIETRINQIIKNITQEIEILDYRKSTIELREFFNIVLEKKEASKKTLENFLKLIAPFCPHIAEELWERMGNKGFISLAEWPKAEEIKIKKQQIDVNERVIKYVKGIIGKLEEKGEKFKKVYLYFVPFEFSSVSLEKLKKGIGKEIVAYSLADEKKYDPQNKSKRAIPGMPGIYVE